MSDASFDDVVDDFEAAAARAALGEILSKRDWTTGLPRPFRAEDVTYEDVRAIAHRVPRQAMAGLMRHEFEAVIAAAWNRLRERG